MSMIALSKAIHFQATFPARDIVKTGGQYSAIKNSTRVVKRTWQLPASVKRAFNESQYKDWSLEKIIKYVKPGKIFTDCI